MEFSHRNRKKALEAFQASSAENSYDLLIIGGGITGVSAARDALSRGLRVALIDREDFAFGTSSRSSKLIHGGLRYLENLEFGLVFEALSERALLLKTVPHLVRPLAFYFPVYQGDLHSRFVLGVGMWLYDFLALFRTPYFHKGFSKKALLEEIPFLKAEGLTGGFRYSDASMWDDLMAIEVARDAVQLGGDLVNYCEAVRPYWSNNLIQGFYAKDRLSGHSNELLIHAKRVLVAGGPWTDELGSRMDPKWKPWLKPSKGVHLVFDLARIPVPGAVVMTEPGDGRISFVIPRPDMGNGVVIVGTTDGPAPEDPSAATIEKNDIEYLMGLLHKYFPALGIKREDILSGYVGVRPLFGGAGTVESGTQGALQKVSREHHLARGPGGSVFVAGGKYTTARKMAEEVVNFILRSWREDRVELPKDSVPLYPVNLKKPQTKKSFAPQAMLEVLKEAQAKAEKNGIEVPDSFWSIYGARSLEVVALVSATDSCSAAGFEHLEAQLRFHVRNSSVMCLKDFYFRRLPIFLARADHGVPWVNSLARVLAHELGHAQGSKQEEQWVTQEVADTLKEIQRHSILGKS